MKGPSEARTFTTRTRNSFFSHKKRARKLKTNLDYTMDDLRAMVEESLTNGYCPYCQEKLTVKNFSADHADPTSRGGSFRIANLLICCRDCNLVKGGMNEEEFRELLAVMRSWPDKVAIGVMARLKAGGRITKRY